MKRDKKTITLGSGSLFIKDFTGNFPETIEEFLELYKELEKPEFELGKISGGATIDYAPEFYTAEDDSGTVKKTRLNKEEATFKTGVITWNMHTLKKLTTTGRVTEDLLNGIRMIKIGGVDNQDDKIYIIHFLHKDKKDGDVRLTIVGKNTSGFSLSFNKDKESVVDAEFKIEPNDESGTLIVFSESIDKTIGILSVSSSEGSTVGKTKILVDPSIEEGRNYKYKTAESVIVPDLGTSCTSGYTNWDGQSEITANSGNQILIVEVDSANKVIKAGVATVVAKS